MVYNKYPVNIDVNIDRVLISHHTLSFGQAFTLEVCANSIPITFAAFETNKKASIGLQSKRTSDRRKFFNFAIYPLSQ